MFIEKKKYSKNEWLIRQRQKTLKFLFRQLLIVLLRGIIFFRQVMVILCTITRRYSLNLDGGLGDWLCRCSCHSSGWWESSSGSSGSSSCWWWSGSGSYSRTSSSRRCCEEYTWEEEGAARVAAALNDIQMCMINWLDTLCHSKLHLDFLTHSQYNIKEIGKVRTSKKKTDPEFLCIGDIRTCAVSTSS